LLAIYYLFTFTTLGAVIFWTAVTIKILRLGIVVPGGYEHVVAQFFEAFG